MKYLNQAHSEKIIHYDLKPQNIIFHNGGVKISDFGLCKEMSSEETKINLTSFGVGTYWYLPPECFQYSKGTAPKISTKVDVWSVGVMFYQMIYNKRPFGNGMTQNEVYKKNVMLNAHKVTFPPKPNITQESKEFILNCLQYYQEDRYDVFEAYNKVHT